MILPQRSNPARRTGIRWWLVTVFFGLAVSLAAAPLPQDSGQTPSVDVDALQAQQTSQPVPAARQASNVAVLTVEGAIDRVTLMSLERRVKDAVENGADAIVIELNTPGGLSGATLDICHLIKNDAPANTVAWVNSNAYSAGSIIALACREIVMSPNARMGDAAPIAVRGGQLIPLPPAERAKQESPILTEVIDSARRNGYDENLVRSLISVGVELWMMENVNTGERIFVDREEYKAVFGEEPAESIPSATPAKMKKSPLLPFSRWDDRAVDKEEIEADIELGQTRQPNRERLTSSDADAWQPIMQVVSDTELLTMTEQEAIYYGLAEKVVADDDEIKAFFDAKTVTRNGGTWSEGLVRFLLNFWVRVILVVVFLVGMFIEMAAPGTGVFGLIAFIAIAILLGAPYLMGASSWWPIAMVGLGVLLVLTELFVIPGVGIAGLVGAASLLIGLVGTFTMGDVSGIVGQGDLLKGVAGTVMGLFVAGVAMWLISRHIYSVPMLEKMILKAELSSSEDASQSTGMLAAMGSAATGMGVSIGDEGVSITDIRPAGRGEFHGKIIEVQVSAGYIERGTRVRVTKITPFAVEVEAVDA